MSEDGNTLTLEPRQHGKVGVYHCGVTRDGFVAVAGDTRPIKEGEEVRFDRPKVAVKRSGNQYTFTKI